MWEIIYLIAVAQDSECNYGHIFYFFAKKVSKLRSAILEDIAKILEVSRKPIEWCITNGLEINTYASRLREFRKKGSFICPYCEKNYSCLLCSFALS